jgi:nucleotide-binding universal stress UspA family protein
MEVVQPSILVLAERAGGAQTALQKASIIARHFGARIELFSCDTEHGWAVRHHSSDPAAHRTLEQCLAATSRYLDALRGMLGARDIEVGTSVACASSMWEGVTTRVESLEPLLIVQGLAEGGVQDARVALRADRIQLVRHATAPLLLAQGIPWAPAPRIVVAADYGTPDPGTHGAIVELAERFRTRCQGWSIAADEPAGKGPEALIAFAARAQADILVVAGPEADSWITLQGSPFETVLSRSLCDVLIVPRRTSVAAVRAALEPGLVAIRTNPPYREPEEG